MDLCVRLQNIIIPTGKLLLYTYHLDLEGFLDTHDMTGLGMDDLIATLCGQTAEAVNYLLNFSHPVETKIFQGSKAYYIELEGRVDGRFMGLDHALILLNDGLNWVMIDSYIGCRGLTCRPVELIEVQLALDKLEEKFDSETWMQLTGCPQDPGEVIDQMKIIIHEYDYQASAIEGQFHSLVEQAKEQLSTEENEIIYEDLYLLDPNLDKQKAGLYLDSLSGAVLM